MKFRCPWALGATTALGVAFLTASFVSTAGCSASNEAPPATEASEITQEGRIQLLVTVDWEGLELSDANLIAMRNFRTRFPQVKLVQFLNAAYFTKIDADVDNTKQRIASVLSPGDEHGLHIHGWKRLVEASGVSFRSSPTFWGSPLRLEECDYDCGHEVPISAYSTDELRKVVKFSLDTLETNGFGRAVSFRSGGWMATESVREAIKAEGMLYEESAVPVHLLRPQIRFTPVHGWLGELWQGTLETSQPYAMATTSGDLVEVPDNGALADYVSADLMVEIFEANKELFARDRRKNVVVSIGFHLETAARYLPRVEEALEKIYQIAELEHLPLENVTTESITLEHGAPALRAAGRHSGRAP